MLTCYSGNKFQTADVSWWPKQRVFMNSGAWQGYWSQDNEDWYQRRCTAIREAYFNNPGENEHGRRKIVSPDHPAAPKVSHKWQNALKLDRKTAKLRAANSIAAEAYLASAAAAAALSAVAY